MPRLMILALGVLSAGCASPLATVPVGPAAPDIEPTPGTVAVGVLPDAPQPDLPPALRPEGRAPGSHDHAGMGAPAPAGRDAATPSGLAATLDAYLALHDALASDDLRATTASAQAFSGAFRAMTERPSDSDPHRWHRQHERVTAIQDAAASLAAATTLDDARTAFGALSLPFADLVEATGTPAGYDLTRHVCGMADAPAGGVWLQRDGDARNPYFGSAMLACGRPTGDAPDAAMEMRTDAIGTETMDHHDH